MEVRREVAPIVVRNRGRSGVADALSALRAEQQAQQAAMLRDGPGAGGEPGAGEGGARDRVKVRGRFCCGRSCSAEWRC